MSTKAEDTQKNILDTARKHFLKDGLTGASLRNIVKDAGLTLVEVTHQGEWVSVTARKD